MIQVAILMLPFAVLSLGSTLQNGQRSAIPVLSLMVLAWAVRDKAVRLFFLWAGAWVFVTLALALGNHWAQPAANRAFEAGTWLLIGAGIYVAAARADTPKNAILAAVCVAVVIQCAVAASQILFGRALVEFVVGGLWPDFRMVFTNRPNWPTGTMGTSNYLGALIVVSLPLFYRRRWAYALLLVLPVLLFLRCSTAAVAAAVGAAFYFRRLKWVAWIAAAGVAFCLLDGADGATNSIVESERWGFWFDTLAKMDTRAWLIGLGPGAQTGYPYPIHHDWLEGVFHYGLFALLPLAVLRDGGDRRIRACLVSAAVVCCGVQAMFLPMPAMTILVLAGLLERDRWRIT